MKKFILLLSITFLFSGIAFARTTYNSQSVRVEKFNYGTKTTYKNTGTQSKVYKDGSGSWGTKNSNTESRSWFNWGKKN